ncbi:MAG: hypothetical protein L0206_20235, partial [Actinobacteria bacterium]|nr:hypothetical protein [Actinomycetota bacterium]
YVESTGAEVDEADPRRRPATVWRPEHYVQVLDELVARVEALSSNGGVVRRVFWGTVPPVTIPPITNGVGDRLAGSGGLESPYGPGDDPQWFRRYFRYYTRPWVPADKFDPTEDDHLTAEQAVRIDTAIMGYKRALQERIDAHNRARQEQGAAPDWFLVDTHWALERLAFRRYRENPNVPPPPGWTPYVLPPELETARVDTRFLRAKDGARISGGLFSLDGVHPTTVGYGIVAQEFIRVMEENGVDFFLGDGRTRRENPIAVDFARLLKLDTLFRQLPQTLDDLWDDLVEGDQLIDVFRRAFRALSGGRI